ncbi:MAG TPA: queuosine precursor transporter [Candidatus Bathyarchaeia archaeon]|nr:queuosine precursor transporter [Candidatus Bathyarchaeia archaeon]
MNELIFLLHALFIGLSTVLMRKLGAEALIAFISVQCIAANIFVLKQISLFCLTATASDAFTVGATLGLELLQENYGQAMAKKAITISFILLAFFCLATYVHLMYIPAPCDFAHLHFATLFAPTPRIIMASLMVYLFVQYAASWLYAFLQKTCHFLSVFARTLIVLIVSQTVDTILFSFLGLYGIVSDIFQVIIISLSVKLAVSFFSTAVLKFIK